MDVPSIQVKVKLTERDLEDFYDHQSRRSLSIKLIILFGLLVFVAQLIRIIVDPTSLQGAIVWIGVVLFIFAMMIYSNKYNARKAARSNKKLLQEYTYSIDHKQIQVTGSNNIKTTLLWKNIYKLTESKNAFYIWLNKHRAQIIPKRELMADQIELISILKVLSDKEPQT